MTSSTLVARDRDLLRYGATLPIDTIDPLRTLWNEASSMVFSRPFAVDEHGTLKPDVVGSAEISDDGQLCRLAPRPGVTWHDGAPLSAQDLAFSLRLVSDPRYRGAFKQYLPDVTEVRVEQGHAVVTLRRPMPTLFHLLSKTCVIPAHCFSAEELRRGALDADPIGTGPYRVAERSERGSWFERHDAYHGGPAAIARIAMVQIAQDEARADALAADDVDLAQVKAQHVDRLEGRDDLVVHPIDTRVWRALTFSLSHPLLRDPAIRRALSTLIDREEVVARALGGYGRPQFYPAPPGSWASPGEPPSTGRDVAFATLTEAGCVRSGAGVWTRDGVELSLTLAYLSTETFRKVASEVIAEQFTAAGIPVSLTSITWAQYQAMDSTGLRGTGYDGIVVGWSAGADPHENLSIRYSSTGAYNRDGYANPELDRLLETASTADRATAAQLYRRVAGIAHRDSIMAPLANPQYLFAARSDLIGFEDFEVDSFYELPQYAHRISWAPAAGGV